MEQKLPILTEENYYSDTEYMSSSRFKSYMNCEAKQLAIDNGAWEEERDKKVFLIGNYIHTAFESQKAHEEYKEAVADKIMSKRGGLLKDYQIADKVIESLEADAYFMKIYNGESDESVQKEAIVTGEIGDMMFKGKVDSLNLTKGYFVDLKTMGNLRDEKYSSVLQRYVPQVIYNIFEFHYPLQMFVYSELLTQTYGKYFTPYIVAVSKQEQVDKELIRIDELTLVIGQEVFEKYVHRLKQVISGKVAPLHCGKCDYCRANNKLARSITVGELLGKD